MRFKKLFLGALASAALLVSGSLANNTAQADTTPAASATTQTQLDKKDIIKKIQDANKNDNRSFHSGEDITVTVKMKKKNIKIKVRADILAKSNPTVEKVVYTVGKDKVTMYATDKYEYSKSGKHWTKTKIKAAPSDLKKLSKKDKKILNKFIQTIEKRIKKNLGGKNLEADLNNLVQNDCTITSSNGDYIVTLSNNAATNNMIKQFLMAFVDASFSKKEAAKVEKALKINNLAFTETIDQNTYLTRNVKFAFQMAYGKKFSITVNGTADEFGQHDNLKVPTKIAKTAKLQK